MNLLKPYFSENRSKLVIGLFCLLLTDLSQLFLPRVIKWVIDDLTGFGAGSGASLARLSVYTLYILGLAIMIGLFRYGWLICFITTARRVEEGLRNRLFEHIQTLSASYFDKTRTGDLMAHATNDMQQIRMATGIGLVTIIDTLFLGTTAIIFMGYINIRLTFFALLPMPLIVLLSWFFSARMHRMYGDVQGTFSELTEVVRERFEGIRIIKAYTQEKESVAAVNSISGEYVRKNLRLAKITGFYTPVIAFLSNLSLVIILWFGGRQTILNTITPGDFVAFNTYLGLLIWPMTAIGSVTNLVQRGKASLDRINRILQTEPEIDDIPDAKSVKRFRHEIIFENVMFSYPVKGEILEDRERREERSAVRQQVGSVLAGIDIRLERGMILGIIGPPGSGKTTLLNLLPRFYDVPSGRILMDGTDIRCLKLRELRSLISFMPQEPFLFAGTIRENITFGDTEIRESELINAVRTAAFDDTVESFSDRFETVVGEKGVVLSGGQKQRVALARAVMRKTPLLILDDPISQVDTETASRIIRGIKDMRGSRTIIIVSHRFSAVRFADQIITLKEGRITESGDHEALAQNQGYYEKTFRLQQVGEALNSF